MLGWSDSADYNLKFSKNKLRDGVILSQIILHSLLHVLSFSRPPHVDFGETIVTLKVVSLLSVS